MLKLFPISDTSVVKLFEMVYCDISSAFHLVSAQREVPFHQRLHSIYV